MIRAIPTEYNGYRFRSRLEARWAVYFDLLGIKYHYEVEGFEDTEAGVRYLPDFYLPDLGEWIEIKPGEASLHERNKAELVSRATNQFCVIAEGDPYYPYIRQFMHQRWSQEAHQLFRDVVELDRLCRDLEAATGKPEPQTLFSVDEEGFTTEGEWQSTPTDTTAAIRARQWRFY